jgi:hypothetical protein
VLARAGHRPPARLPRREARHRPPTDSGFYCDIDLAHKLTADDLIRLEAEMKKVIDEKGDEGQMPFAAFLDRVGEEVCARAERKNAG